MNKNTEAPQVEANNKAVKYLILPRVNNKVIDYGRRLKDFIESKRGIYKIQTVISRESNQLFQLQNGENIG